MRLVKNPQNILTSLVRRIVDDKVKKVGKEEDLGEEREGRKTVSEKFEKIRCSRCITCNREPFFFIFLLTKDYFSIFAVVCCNIKTSKLSTIWMSLRFVQNAD